MCSNILCTYVYCMPEQSLKAKFSQSCEVSHPELDREF